MRKVPSATQDDFFAGRRDAVPFVIDDNLEVVGGPHAGRCGTPISIESLNPTRILVEFGDDGSDAVIDAALLHIVPDDGPSGVRRP